MRLGAPNKIPTGAGPCAAAPFARWLCRPWRELKRLYLFIYLFSEKNIWTIAIYLSNAQSEFARLGNFHSISPLPYFEINSFGAEIFSLLFSEWHIRHSLTPGSEAFSCCPLPVPQKSFRPSTTSGKNLPSLLITSRHCLPTWQMVITCAVKRRKKWAIFTDREHVSHIWVFTKFSFVFVHA